MRAFGLLSARLLTSSGLRLQLPGRTVTVNRAIRGGADRDDPGDAGGAATALGVAAPSRHLQLLRIQQLAGRQRRLGHKTDLRSVSATTIFAGVYCRPVILLISCGKAFG
jgi:hypothetical protein